jgi:hypothetical protein
MNSCRTLGRSLADALRTIANCASLRRRGFVTVTNIQLMQECGREVHFEIAGPEIPYSALHYVANAFVIASR